jgi:uncharacterized coiled-coil protein SlyX
MTAALQMAQTERAAALQERDEWYLNCSSHVAIVMYNLITLVMHDRRSKYESIMERWERSESRHENRYREVEGEVERLRPLTTSVTQLRQQLSSRDELLSNQSRDVSDHQQRIRDLESKLTEQTRTIESLNTLQSAQTTLITTKNNEVVTATERASQADSSLSSLRDQHANEVRQLQNMINEAKARQADAMDGERLAAEHARAAANRAAEAEVWAARAAAHVPVCDRCNTLEKQLSRATKGHLRDIHSLEHRLESLQSALSPSPSLVSSASAPLSHSIHHHHHVTPAVAAAAAASGHHALLTTYPPSAADYRRSFRSP